jgi:uncharacterized protein YlxP (DUF503 family)
MVVAVAVFEIHIPHAQSLKEKRMVVKSLRDRIRNRFEVSAAEVGLQELHQRARLGVAIVSGDEKVVTPVLEEIVGFIEQDAALLGWSQEIVHFDDDAAQDLPHLKFR